MNDDLEATWRECQATWSLRVLQDEARRLTSLGWPVTPLRVTFDHEGNRLKKRPIWSNWLGKGLLGEADIASLSGERVHLLGLVLPTGLLLLDFENKNGSVLRETYGTLQAMYGPLPQQAVGQKTLTRGMHSLYRLATDVADASLEAKIRLPDGTPVAVDVVRHGFLCAAIYEVGFPSVGPDSDEIPPLPRSWHPGILKQNNRQRALGVISGTKDRRSVPHPEEALTDLANTPPGNRNKSLLAATRHLMLTGRWTESMNRQVLAAAISSGLDEDGASGTVASAGNFAIHRVWRPFLSWLADVQRTGIEAPTEPWDLACLLCWRMVVAKADPEKPFAISDRELSGWLGVDETVVRRRMDALIGTGLVSKSARRDAFHHPTEYRLIIPALTAESSIIPSEGEALVVVSERLMTYSAVVGALERISLGRHRMFQQMNDGSLWLPKSGVRILHALWRTEGSGVSTSAMARHTGLNRNTVSRTVKDLEQHGLLVRDGKRRIRLAATDPVGLLDELAERYGVPDRESVRRERHEQERKALDLYDRRKYRGRYGPKAVRGRVSFKPEDWDAVRLREEREER